MDNSITSMRQHYIKKKMVTFLTKEESLDLDLEGLEVIEARPHKTKVEVDINKTPVDVVIEQAMKQSRLRDITVEDPPMEEIVQDIYQQF
jgi:ABC-2 type transport system ATP-binding protein